MNVHAPDFATPTLTRQDGERVAHLRLNRPMARNCLSLAAMAELIDALEAIARDESIHVTVLSAEGPAFCAGHDLKELSAHRADADHGAAFFAHTFALCSRLMRGVAELPKPVIAAIEGLATAAGCQLAASCDLAIAGEAAAFCTPGVNIGLFCSTPMVAVTRTVAPKHAMEMLLAGEPIGAREAFRIGLVNRIVPAGEALASALALARRIASKSRAAIAAGKRAYHDQAYLPLAEAYAAASRAMVDNMLDDSAREGIAAILERRAPEWPR